MVAKKRSELAKTYAFNTWQDITPMQVSQGTMLYNKTGSWRFIKPIYEDKVPICQNACPAGNDIEGWLKLLEKKEYEKAYWHLKREEPFPAILGRVCFKFCEDACNRTKMDQCISIKELERFIGDQVTAATPHPEIPADNGKRLAVVGSGPAGMSAAYFARRLGFNVRILEKSEQLGGLLVGGIPTYRLPQTVVAAEFEGLANMGVELQTNTEIGKDVTLADLTATFDYIFLASGAHKSMPLELENNVQHPRVMSGLDMLRKVSRGEDIYLGKHVVVVGGGNTAIDAARTAIRLGSQVTVLYRRSEDEMPAHPDEVQEAREEGVVFKFLSAPEKIVLDDDGNIQRLVCCEMELGPTDDSGRRRPVRKEGATFDMPADSALTAIGETPDFDYLGHLVDPSKTFISVGSNLSVQSSTDDRAKIYAGGDIIDIPRTVVHAVASGKRAAVAMDCDRKGVDVNEVLNRIAIGNGPAISFSKYMGWPAVNPVRRNDNVVVDSTMVVYDYFEKTSSVDKDIRSGDTRKGSFKPYHDTLSAEDAHHEALRCMHCGRCTGCDNCLIFCPDVSILDRAKDLFGYEIDYDYCKGCGICATECPRSAITMINEATPTDTMAGEEA